MKFNTFATSHSIIKISNMYKGFYIQCYKINGQKFKQTNRKQVQTGKHNTVLYYITHTDTNR